MPARPRSRPACSSEPVRWGINPCRQRLLVRPRRLPASAREGRLYGKDAARLSAADGRDRPPERLNPVHRLWRPPPDGGTGLLGRADREFLVDRIGRDGDDPLFVRNATADLPAQVADALPLADAIPIESVAEFNDLAEARYVPAFERLAADIEATDVAVVESYSDIARPLEALSPSSIAAVAAVEPGRARIYPGDRYCRACEIASSSPRDGAIEKRVPDVLDYLDPLERVSLPALGSDRRADPERVARAYADATRRCSRPPVGVEESAVSPRRIGAWLWTPA